MHQKKILFAMFLSLALTSPIYAQAGDCAQKKIAIERQLKYAEQFNNQYEVARLKKALERNTKCDDRLLRAKYEAEVAQKKAKVAKKTVELEEARRTGSASKIARRTRDLDKAQHELEKAQQKLGQE